MRGGGESLSLDSIFKGGVVWGGGGGGAERERPRR